MPWGDWQFWVVTALAISAVWLIVRSMLPTRKPTRTRVDLTVERKPTKS